MHAKGDLPQVYFYRLVSYLTWTGIFHRRHSSLKPLKNNRQVKLTDRVLLDRALLRHNHVD